MLAREFLLNGGTLEQLQADKKLLVRRGTEFPNLVLLKYDQIESPMADPLVQQCRGVILDEADEWRVVSRPFDKFFNHGEQLAAPIDWSTAVAQEKLDGSLIQLYHYAGQWRVGTSGTPDAAGEVNGCGFTFAELFWRVFGEYGYPLPAEDERHLTFMFELMTPYNRVVVRHDLNRLILIGVREHGGQEQALDKWMFAPVRSFPLQSFADIEATFTAMNPLEQEGYVVIDGAYRRVKVKHPGYVAIHHMRDGLSPKRVLEAVRTGESTEILAHFPEWTEAFNTIQAKYEGLVGELEADFTKLRGIPGQKDFALEAVKTRYSPALFQVRKGQAPSVRHVLATMTLDKLADLLDIRGGGVL